MPLVVSTLQIMSRAKFIYFHKRFRFIIIRANVQYLHAISIHYRFESHVLKSRQRFFLGHINNSRFQHVKRHKIRLSDHHPILQIIFIKLLRMLNLLPECLQRIHRVIKVSIRRHALFRQHLYPVGQRI